MFLPIPWLKIALIGGVLLAVYLAYNWFTGVLDENNELKTANAMQAETIKAKEAQIEFEKYITNIEREARNEAEQEVEIARQEEKKLISLFQEHDFDNLLQKKPGLILNRINNGTQRLFSNAADSINFDPAARNQVPEPAESR